MARQNLHPFNVQLDRLVQLAVRNRVTFHGMNITKDHTGGLEQEMGISLNELAARSGGIYANGPNLEASLTQALDMSRYVYLLGYKAPSAKTGKYHKIKVKCRKKKAVLRFREGYFGSY